MKPRLLPLALALLLALTGCGGEAVSSSGNATPAEDYFSHRDLEGIYDPNHLVDITLSETGIHCDSSAVTVEGTTATITEEGTYRLRGTLDSGMVIVDTDKHSKVQLVLDNCSITSPQSAAIYVRQADKVFITTAQGSENTLSNGGSFVAIDDSNIDATLFSKDDLTLNGAGTLTILSPAGHGVVSKDSLTVAGGSYAVTAASHGLEGKDDVCVTNATLTIVSGKDGIHTENEDDTALGYFYTADSTFHITAEGDGISAASYLTVDSGSYTITAGGGYENGQNQSSGNWGSFMPGGGPGGGPRPGGDREPPGQMPPQDTADTTDSTSMKGLKAEGALTINGGNFTLNCADDAIHSNGDLTVAGGEFTLSSGDDAVHAENILTIHHCQMTVEACYEGLEALELYLNGGDIHITATDDGLNASGGKDASGISGGRDGRFGGTPGGGGFGQAMGLIEINGGNLTILASGDGLDSNGDLTINGGLVIVSNPTAGDTSVLDSQNRPLIHGGTYLGLGATTMMAESFGDQSTQAVLACTTGNQSAGTDITIADSQGNQLFTYHSAYPFVLMIYSAPELEKGADYHITAGTASGTVTAD